MKQYGDKSEIMQGGEKEKEKEREGVSRRAQYRKPLASLENDVSRCEMVEREIKPALPILNNCNKPPIPFENQAAINKRLQKVWK